VLFIASPGDEAEIRALRAARADYIVLTDPPGPGDFARKTNAGYHATSEPFLFAGADDLRFHPGWDVAALRPFENAAVGVVGTNDLCNPRVIRGQHSTHSMVRRTYADEHGVIDRPGAIYCEEYPHEFVDDEFCETARFRKAWAFAKDAKVEHLHPNCGKGQEDELYAARRERQKAGSLVFRRRRKLWNGSDRAPVSVLVATFGDESWRQLASERAVASVERQRMQPAECITVHGESLASARNEAARRATSPWLCFLDADDELHPRFLHAISRQMRDGVGLLNPAVQTVMPNGRNKPPRVFKPKDLSGGNFLVLGTVVRTELFFEAGGFEEKWEAWEDWQMWRKVVALGGKIQSVPQAIYRYYWRADSRNNTVDRPKELMARMRSDFDEWAAAR
jgi:hypothetical protein